MREVANEQFPALARVNGGFLGLTFLRAVQICDHGLRVSSRRTPVGSVGTSESEMSSHPKSAVAAAGHAVTTRASKNMSLCPAASGVTEGGLVSN